jgi:hypothetical protein
MTRAVQKALELEQFEEFARASGIVPTGERSQPEPPEPDIVIRAPDGQCYGIELTEIAPGGAAAERRRRTDVMRKRILAEARALYNTPENQRPFVHVWVGWRSDGQAPDAHRAAPRLCEFVVQHPPNGDTIDEHFQVGAGSARDWPISYIGVAPASALSGGDWRNADMYMVRPLLDEELRTRIEQEGEKVGRYQGTYSHRWLIFVHSSHLPSTWSHVTRAVRDREYRSRYDRIFLLDLGGHRYEELTVTTV